MSLPLRRGLKSREMRAGSSELVQLELHTGDLARACDFYFRVLGWRAERIETGCAPYVSLGVGTGIEGGIVECATARPLWLPYAEVADVEATTARARAAGARVLLEAREGPRGWRSVVAAPDGAEIALWQPK